MSSIRARSRKSTTIGALLSLALLTTMLLAGRASAAEPTVESASATEVTESTARISAEIDPQGAQTSYYFEWGTDSSYGQRIPLNPASLGSVSQSVLVSRRLSGLESETTYHFRVVAENIDGESLGDGQTFTTSGMSAACSNAQIRSEQGSEHLPNCMAWEKVSPDDKNGGNPYYSRGLLQASTDGSRVAWSAPSSFGGQGAPRVSDYLSRAADGGWVTQNISPNGADPISAFTIDSPVGYSWFDANLQSGLFVQNDDPRIHRNLYSRAFDASVSTRLTADPVAEPLAAFSAFNVPTFREVSADQTRVLYETLSQQTPAGPTPLMNSHLYMWNQGETEFVGYLPDGTPAPESVAGRGAFIAPVPLNAQTGDRTMSEDGSRIFFTVPRAGAPEVPAVGQIGEVYMRENGETTHISASQRTDCADDPTCGGDGVPDPAPDPATAGNAVFGTATPDGAYVFLISCADLTDDADGECQGSVTPLVDHRNIYRYEVATGELVNITASAPKPMRDIIGISDDGKTAYLENMHSPNAAYIWREGGQIETVGPADDRGDDINVSYHLNSLRQSRVSEDGRYLLWFNRPGGPETLAAYLYDAATEETACVSCPSDGSPVTSPAAISSFKTGVTAKRDYRSEAMDNARRWVFFSTEQSLVANDTNGSSDVYRYEIATGTQTLMSSGRDRGDAFYGDISDDGSTVFIVTDQRLVGGDVDSQRDVYAVHMNGGFAEPEPGRPSCDGDECQGPSVAPPATDEPGSSGQSNGNPSVRPKPEQCSHLQKKARKKLRKSRNAKPRRSKQLKRQAKQLKRQAKQCRRRNAELRSQS